MIVHLPFVLNERADSNVSSMNWKWTILPSRTFAWIENGEVNTFPSETERYLNEPKTATFSPTPKRSVTLKSSIVQ